MPVHLPIQQVFKNKIKAEEPVVEVLQSEYKELIGEIRYSCVYRRKTNNKPSGCSYHLNEKQSG